MLLDPPFTAGSMLGVHRWAGPHISGRQKRLKGDWTEEESQKRQRSQKRHYGGKKEAKGQGRYRDEGENRLKEIKIGGKPHRFRVPTIPIQSTVSVTSNCSSLPGIAHCTSWGHFCKLPQIFISIQTPLLVLTRSNLPYFPHL